MEEERRERSDRSDGGTAAPHEAPSPRRRSRRQPTEHAGHRTPPRWEERCPVSGCELRSGDEANLLRLRTLLALRDFELHALSVFKQLVAVHLDCGEVDEDVRPPVNRDESIALLAVEPLDGALCHGALPHFNGAGAGPPGPPPGATVVAPKRTLHEALRRRTPLNRTLCPRSHVAPEAPIAGPSRIPAGSGRY